jgi:hypothetical protein
MLYWPPGCLSTIVTRFPPFSVRVEAFLYAIRAHSTTRKSRISSSMTCLLHAGSFFCLGSRFDNILISFESVYELSRSECAMTLKSKRRPIRNVSQKRYKRKHCHRHDGATNPSKLDEGATTSRDRPCSKFKHSLLLY